MTRPRRIALNIMLGLIAYILSACSVPAEPEVVEEIPVEIIEELTPQQIVNNWLECEDCLDGELEAVLELGEEAVSLLLEALRAGPPPEILEEAEESLTTSYREVLEYAEKHPELEMEIPQTEGEYVFFYIGNLYVQYASRSSIALTAIGEPASLKEIPIYLYGYAEEYGREDLIDMLDAALGDTLR